LESGVYVVAIRGVVGDMILYHLLSNIIIQSKIVCQLNTGKKVKSFFEVLKSVKLSGGLLPCFACSVFAAAKLHYGCGSLVPRRFLALV
jgi:hypothetical protein